MLSSFLKRLLLARQADFAPTEIKILGLNYSMLPLAELVSLQQSLKRSFGERGLLALYAAGKQFSIATIEQLKQRYGVKGNELATLCLSLIQTCGYGELKVISFKPRQVSAVIHMRSLFAQQHPASSVPVDWHLGGVLAGLVEGVSGTRADAKETKCMACGQPHCEFIVRRASR